MASFAAPDSVVGTGRAALGYATRIGDSEDGGSPIYIAAFWNGSLWNGKQGITYTEGNGIWLSEANKSGVKTVNAYNLSAGNPYNQLAVLVGFGDMGIRLTYTTTYQSYKDSDYVYSGDFIKSSEEALGWNSPQIAWSMTKNLTDNGIRPWATFELGFFKDYRKYNEYYNDGGTWKSDNETVSRSNNRNLTKFGAGLGGYTIANKNSWRTAADLDYALDITSYNNEYNYTKSAGNIEVASFKGTASDMTERSAAAHTITPSIATQWNGEGLRLRAKLNLNIPIGSSSSTAMTINTDGSGFSSNGALHKNGTESSVSSIGFNPDLRLAAQWQLSPKIFLNSGLRVEAQAATRTTTKSASYSDNAKVANSDSESVVTAFGGFRNRFSLGFAINATDNLTIDMSSIISANNNSNNVSVFDTDKTAGTANGLFNFTSLMVFIRY